MSLGRDDEVVFVVFWVSWSFWFIFLWCGWWGWVFGVFGEMFDGGFFFFALAGGGLDGRGMGFLVSLEVGLKWLGF